MSAHPHAALMALYAQDAAETEAPWDRWECSSANITWYDLKKHPEWIEGCQYRRKPHRWETWVNREANMIGCSAVDMSPSKGWEKITVMEVMP